MPSRFLLSFDDEEPDLSSSELSALRTLSCVCSSLSMAGALWMMLSVVYFGKWRRQVHFRYVFMLSVAQLLNEAAYLLYDASGQPEVRGLCVAQGALMMFGSKASVGW